MRFSTVASFLTAIILAIAAVYGVQTWLELERSELQASFQRQATETDTKPKPTIVVAGQTIGFGERIEAGKLREIEWTDGFRPDGSFRNINEVVVGDTEETARFALVGMTAGEPILTTKITVPGQRAKMSTALTPGKKAVSIRVNDVLGVAGFVLPGDRVDVLLTRGGRGSESYVDVLLQGVKVLAIDQLSDGSRDKPGVVRTVTFEVNTLEAQKLVLGGNVGTLSLALRNVASTDIEDRERVTLQDLSELDAADDLVQATKQEEEEQDPNRLDELEQLLKNLSSGLTDRLAGVEQKINETEPVIVEKEVIVEKQVPISRKHTIGVIRNGRRDEYKVDRAAENEDGNAEVTSGGGTLEVNE